MKHFRLTLALAAVMLIAEIFTASALIVRKGDINNDGDVTVTDARLALRFAVQLDEPTEIQEYCADVDGTKGISVADARIILRVAVSLQTLEDSPKEFITIQPSRTEEESTSKSDAEVVPETETAAQVSTTETTSEESTTEEVTTEETTTEEATTEEVTTEENTTEEETSEEVTTEGATTEEETTTQILHTHEFTGITADHSLNGKHKVYCKCGEHIIENCECTEKTVPATCTQGECVIYTCTKCLDVRAVTALNPLGHDCEVLPDCIFANKPLIKNNEMYVAEWPICSRCGKAPTDDISLFNNTVNLIKNDFNYTVNHKFAKITKTDTTTVTNTEKTETTYGAWLVCTDFENSERLPYSSKKISSLTNDDIESFDVEYLKDGLGTLNILKDYPDIITVNEKQKNISSFKNKTWNTPAIKMTVKIKPESFTVGSTESDNLYAKYTKDKSYKCAISRITNELTPLSDAEAFGSNNDFVFVSEQNGITTSITLKDITVSATVSYYFDYNTLCPLFAVYNLQQTTGQIVKVTVGTNIIQDTPTTKTKQCEQIYIFE